jgi:hypothetical protein
MEEELVEQIARGNLTRAIHIIKHEDIDPNYNSEYNGYAPLHIIYNHDLDINDAILLTNMLLEIGADVNIKDINGNTPLLFATRFKNKKQVDFLLSVGADPDAKNNSNKSPKDIEPSYFPLVFAKSGKFLAFGTEHRIISEYKGRVAFMFLVVRPLKNPIIWENFFRGYEDYYSVYFHISGKDYDKQNYWPQTEWENRVEAYGIPHTQTAWGTVSLVKAEGLLYKAALKNRSNKFFCLLSESDIPLWSFPEFYNRLNTKDKSYITMDSAKGDESIFEECFPEKYIPSSNRAQTRDQRDARKIIMRTAHQWKILTRREAKEFIKMCNDKQYLTAYEKCYKFDPYRLAPDEYSFSNWLVLKYGLDYLKKHVINIESTFVYFTGKAEHAKEFKHIHSWIKDAICDDEPRLKPFFARKFAPSRKLLGELPMRCSKKKKHFSKKNKFV